MAVCLINKGLTKDNFCGYSLPKIVELYLANFADVTSTTLTESKQEVATITMADTKKWYKVDPATNSASWSDNLAVGANGNKYRIQTIGFSFQSAYDTDMADTVDAFSLGKYIAVARMADGSYIMLGRNTGLEAQADGANNSGSGDATAEGGLVVSLTANTIEVALPLAKTAIDTVIGNQGA